MGDRNQRTAKNPRQKWVRRGDVRVDMLHAFESGDLYDCTIRVGCDLQDLDSNCQVTTKIALHHHTKFSHNI